MEKIKSLFVSGILLLISFSVYSQKVGIFDGHGDIGVNVKPGSATFIPQTDQ